MDPLKIYDYLTKARERVFDAVRPLTPEQYHHQFTIGLKTISSTLTHMMIVEWSYAERMQRRPVPAYDSWPIQDEKPPAFEVIEKTWRGQAVQTRGVVQAAYEAGIEAWNGEFEYTYSRGGDSNGKMTILNVSPADIFTQLLVHEIHHRAQVMAMLRELGTEGGKPLENLDFGYLMFKRREVQEASAKGAT